MLFDLITYKFFCMKLVRKLSNLIFVRVKLVSIRNSLIMVKYRNAKLKLLWVWPQTFQAAGSWDMFGSLFLLNCQKCRFWHGFIVWSSFWSLQISALAGRCVGHSICTGRSGAAWCSFVSLCWLFSCDFWGTNHGISVFWCALSSGELCDRCSISHKVAAVCSVELVCWKQSRWATGCCLGSESSPQCCLKGSIAGS